MGLADPAEPEGVPESEEEPDPSDVDDSDPRVDPAPSAPLEADPQLEPYDMSDDLRDQPSDEGAPNDAGPLEPEPLIEPGSGPAARAPRVKPAAVKPEAVEPRPVASEPEPSPAVVDLGSPAEACAQCGAPLAPTDIFCPECGFVRQRTSGRSRPADTARLDPFPWGLPREPEPARPAVPPATQVTPAPPVTAAAPVTPPAPASAATAPAIPAAGFTAAEPDIDETRIVDRSGGGERFVLQFSTGESVRVSGTGLIGRNPAAEPGEYFDVLVTIVDPGRSVSKTHLEFGQEGGAFWVSDRFSGNGTVVREPDRQPRRCDAGKRYRVARGTRVEIGEQFFIVS